MPSYNTNLKTWGSSGQEPPNNYNYAEGEQPVDAWDNWLMTQFITDIEHLVDVTNNELLARDGSVDLAADLSDDNANTIYDYSKARVPVDRLAIRDGESQAIDASEFSGSDGSSGQILKTDGSSTSWASPGGNAVSNDDMSDVNFYRLQTEGSGTLINVSQAGTFLGGNATAEGNDFDGNYVSATITVDGVSNSFSGAVGSDEDGTEHSLINLPTISCDSSLQISLSGGGSRALGATGWFKPS